jgi:branched-chain amino acid transport system substrate-binding protein
LSRAAAVTALAALAAGCTHGADPEFERQERAIGWPVRAAACEPLYYERPGTPQAVIVSDLPMQGADRSFTGQMAQAVKVVLKYRYGFRAGGLTVGYQVCDHSGGRTGRWSRVRCAGNALAYSRVAQVLGVVGPLDSGCARAALPQLNAAPGGPLAAVSPTATAVGLTRPGPGAEAGEPDRYAPSGERSFVRLAPADDAQGAAAAVVAARLDVARVFVLEGPGGYGAAVAGGFAQAAPRAGVEVAGSARWPAPEDASSLASVVRAAGADGVLIAGRLADGGADLLEALRARLGPDVRVFLPDGFTPVPVLVEEAGEAADGAFLTVGVQRVDDLGPGARSFASEFREHIGSPPHPYVVYAAQAADLLLHAIGESDGTRRSVTGGVMHARIEDGILGSFEVDAAGELHPALVGVYRIDRGRPVHRDVVAVSGSGG